MEKEVSYELIGSKGHCFDFIIILPVPVGKGDVTVINGEDVVVCYGHPVSIAARMLKSLLRTSKRTFCIGNPYNIHQFYPSSPWLASLNNNVHNFLKTSYFTPVTAAL